MGNRIFIRKVLSSYILHKLEDNVLTIMGDSQHTIGGIEPFYKISHKNCEAIELGYDLNKFILEEFPYDFDCPLFETLGITERVQKSILIGMLQGTLSKGFNKALEILGDKKLSVKDVQDFINVENPSQYPYIAVNLERKLNEWDVEILTDICGDKVYAVPEYVLDEEGCLILKAITK